jgi:hypothetical protein
MGRKWSPEDEELLTKLYPYFGDNYLMRRFKRSKGSIQSRAAGLGLQKKVIKKETGKKGGPRIRKEHMTRIDYRRTHNQNRVFRRIIENQRRAGFLKG